ncbi:histidine ammonia-lyase [Silvanigrella aquatica]|uniref:Histidine ammonia-lyase n=1 Tax=Silvanigrella aquatica TaxID=1915309 RepID=A0A1L4D3X9_9BACT|nr:histidine ammonia-lyase [Silvanigrella aquatica]APJ04889.1 histidine ammonia-lyase [Silvanigrella aquatica]
MQHNNDFFIKPGHLTLNQLKMIYDGQYNKLFLSEEAKINLDNSVKNVNNLITEKNPRAVYGVNTGFGKLASTRINEKDLSTLQHNLVKSHCTGVGDFLDERTVSLISVIKIASLSMGYSGVRYELLDALLKLINNGYFPCVPIKGSVGASGDLAPLAHLVAPLIGVGYVQYKGNKIQAQEALKECHIESFDLLPLEGLSLLNGTQVSTALALKGLFKIQSVFESALVSGTLALEALNGNYEPFDPRIHELRGHKGQMIVAEKIRGLLSDNYSKKEKSSNSKVQDPYSLRCQPQVMGACLDQINHVAKTLETEANAVTNNPIAISETGEFLSGGNFHAEPVAFAADILAMVCTEISSLSERRISLMVDSNSSGLPSFLVNNSGLNSGFMIAQVTAAALVSENKSRSFPCSVDSIPTSANQEDHVSMATHAAFRLNEMAENSAYVIAIEMLAAAQAFDLQPHKNIPNQLKSVYTDIRNRVPFYEKDRYFADDIELVKQYLLKNSFNIL